MFIAVVLSILLVLDLAWLFGAVWLQRRAAAGRNWRWITVAFVAAQVIGLCVIMLMRFGPAQPADTWRKALASAVFIWHLLLLPLGASLLWFGLGSWGMIRLGGALRRIFSRQTAPLKREAESVPVPRRQFLAASLALIPPFLTAAATTSAVTQLRNFRVRRFTINLPQLPAALDGITIAHLSDLHVGPFTSGGVLDDVVRETNNLGADLIVFTGDLINTSLSDLPEAIRLVQRLEARYGVYLIEGNHDLIDNGQEFTRRVRGAGINLLINQAATLPISGVALQLLGLRWGSPRQSGSRKNERGDGAIFDSFKELLKLRDPSAFPILLAHHPHAFDSAILAGVPLTLAGHTHGGQLMVNEEVGFGPVMFRYWSGLYTRADNHLVVSNGVGNWFPLRIQAPAEIVHITLRQWRSS